MLFLVVFVSFVAAVQSTYIVTCHNNNECGTVCGYYADNMVAPTEGLFGTSCKCQSGSTVSRCNALGVDVRVCSDYKPPSCSTACGQNICITKDGRKTTGKILSACPKNHPQNTQQCCDHPTSRDYCTCVIQDTLDLNAQPYAALGNTNGYSTSAVWGACSSQLASLNIAINSTRASELVKPFLRDGTWCSAIESQYQQELTADYNVCSGLGEAQCGSMPGCVYCNSDAKDLKSECFQQEEADVLTHVVNTEYGAGKFTCKE
jgi:hypothetical protein